MKLFGAPGTPPSALPAIQGAELRKEAGETMQGGLGPQAEPAVAPAGNVLTKQGGLSA